MERGRFYDTIRIEQRPLPSAPPTPQLPVDYGAGAPNSYTGNDYRNRMPFHVVDEQTGDDFYVWQYGQTMELLFTFGDEQLEEQPYVTDVTLSALDDIPEPVRETIVDRKTKIAHLTLGSMAFTEKELYPKKDYIASRITKLATMLNSMRSDAVVALTLLQRIQEEMDKGDEMNSKLIEELQHQIVKLKEDTDKRFTALDEKFTKELEDLKKVVAEGDEELRKTHEKDIKKVYETFTQEITWEFDSGDWTSAGEYFHFEHKLPIEDASEYDITASIAVKEVYAEKDVTSYATGHTFNWFVLDKNKFVLVTKEPMPPGLLSVYMTKKTS